MTAADYTCYEYHAPVGKCHHPEKVRYYVEREAKAQAERIANYPNGKEMWVYACGMHFHLTSHRIRPRPLRGRQSYPK